MATPKIVVVHKLPHRLRINFPEKKHYTEKLKKFVLDHKGIRSFTFDFITQNALILFDPFKMDHRDVISRVVVGIIKEAEKSELKVHDHTEKTSFTAFSLSLIALMLANTVDHHKTKFYHTFYLGAVISLVHSVASHFLKESISTALYKITTFKHPETHDEFYNVDIHEGGHIIQAISGAAKPQSQTLKKNVT